MSKANYNFEFSFKEYVPEIKSKETTFHSNYARHICMYKENIILISIKIDIK